MNQSNESTCCVGSYRYGTATGIHVGIRTCITWYGVIGINTGTAGLGITCICEGRAISLRVFTVENYALHELNQLGEIYTIVRFE